jgi:5'-nucleotidase
VVPLLLITNDDGVDSPGLHALARAHAELGDLRIVAPSGQRSWIGKAITRHDPIVVESVERDGMEMLAVDGTPADCSQIGIHNQGQRPDLVLSGINIGSNAGSAYVMGSGTVGAALEASISAVPAIAFSAMSWDDWDAYNDFVLAPESRSYWDRMASVCARVTATVLERGFPDCDVLNINITVDADATTRIVGSRVADTAYTAVFDGKGPGVYTHDYSGLSHIETADDTDIAALRRGEVAATPLRLRFGSTPGADFDGMFR